MSGVIIKQLLTYLLTIYGPPAPARRLASWCSGTTMLENQPVAQIAARHNIFPQMGRGRKTWYECVKDDMKALGLHPEWAVFRDMWRGFISGGTSNPSWAWKEGRFKNKWWRWNASIYVMNLFGAGGNQSRVSRLGGKIVGHKTIRDQRSTGRMAGWCCGLVS